MRALILTYDARVQLAELVIKSYNKLWPGHPLRFIVPFNQHKPSFARNPNVRLVKTQKHVKPTMQKLLQGIHDEEFIFWAFDDIYPKELSAEYMQDIYNYLTNNKVNFDCVRLLSANKPKLLSRPSIKIGEMSFHSHFTKNGFWIHQFIKAKILKKLFLLKELPQNYKIRYLDRKNKFTLVDHSMYIPIRSIGKFGETTRHDVLTKNAADDMSALGIPLPRIKQFNSVVIINNKTIEGKPELKRYVGRLQRAHAAHLAHNRRHRRQQRRGK